MRKSIPRVTLGLDNDLFGLSNGPDNKERTKTQ